MRILFFGTGSFGLPALEALQKSSHKLSAVVTSPDKPKGRGLKPAASPVKEWAVRQRLGTFEFSKPLSSALFQKIQSQKADVFVVISFGFILPKEVLTVPRFYPLNVHASLLPRYRGAAPIPWAILSGEEKTGVSVIRIGERLDAGDVLLKKEIPILPEEDAHSLTQKLSLLGAGALIEALSLVESGRAAFTPQDESQKSYARKIQKEDGHIRWDNPVRLIQNHVRAFLDWPGSYSFLAGERLIVHEVEPAPGHRGSPGTVLSASPSQGMVIAARDGALRIKTLQLEGKKRLSAGEFLKGRDLQEGTRLE